ncbi:MAG: ATP-grasp domain-containing protein [Candidatus Thiodiazotropha sp.]
MNAETGNYRPPAVIAGAFQTGVLGVRSLVRHGIKAICFDCNPTMHGFRSRYGPARLCPNPDDLPDEWLDFMLALSDEIGEKAVLIPSSDRYVTAIANHREVLREQYIFSPGVDLQGLLAHKQTQYRMAEEHGMPMPLTRMINSVEELHDFSQAAHFPCLVKPWHFREWEKFSKDHPLYCQKVSVAENEEALLKNYQLASEINTNVVLQEIIQGPDTSKRVYLSCYDKQSKRIANAMFQELRCVPFGFGPASVTVPIVDEEADEVCDNFLKSIGYKGICEIEVKRDSRDGKVKLIEANPRLSGGGDAAPYAGVDLCWIHYQELTGVEVAPVKPSGKYFKHIVLRAEGTAIPEYIREGLLTWREVFKTYKPPVAFFDLDRKDLKMSMETILVTFKTLLTNLFFKRKM